MGARSLVTDADPTILPLGDRAIVVDLTPLGADLGDPRVRSLARHLASSLADLDGWDVPAPAATSVLVGLDPVSPGVAAALPIVRATVDAWRDRVARGREAVAGRTSDHAPVESLEVPVRYGGADGPDLDEVARRLGLTTAEVIDRHTGTVYEAAFLGFAPGFAYLGPLPPSLVLPRRDSPRTRVPAGSVAIAGPQTAIYPSESPGGWWLLGHTDLAVWDPQADPPARIAPGARIRFVATR